MVAGSIDDPGVVELLALAVGDGDERLRQAIELYRGGEPTVGLLIAIAEQRPVAVLGFALTDAKAVVLHLATTPPARRTGVGTSLLNSLLGRVSTGSSVVAETDAEAVGFYRSNGFRVTTLGEKYPGVERFRVTLDRNRSIKRRAGRP